MPGTDSSGARARYGHGLLTTISENARAYGFSVMITATFGVLTTKLGPSSEFDVFAFLAGAAIAFMLVDAVSSRGFRLRARPDPPDVVALGAALSLVSIGISVAAAALAAELLQADVGWPFASFLATLTYLLVVGAELTLARRLQERREDREVEAARPDEG